MRLMEELPDWVKGEIYIDYLFHDFLQNYRKYFNPRQERQGHMIFK